MIYFHFFRNFGWPNSRIDPLRHSFVQVLLKRISVAMVTPVSSSDNVWKIHIPWRMTIPLRFADHQAYLTLQSTPQVTLAQCCISCRMEASASRRRRSPTRHRKWGLSPRRRRGTRSAFQVGNCTPWARGPWPWRDSAAPTADLRCRRRCPRRAAGLHTCSRLFVMWGSGNCHSQSHLLFLLFS